MNKTPIKVSCPTCQTKVVYSESSPFRPFCSERCQQIDLGAWSTEEYSIPCDQQDEWEIEDQTNKIQNHPIQ